MTASRIEPDRLGRAMRSRGPRTRRARALSRVGRATRACRTIRATVLRRSATGGARRHPAGIPGAIQEPLAPGRAARAARLAPAEDLMRRDAVRRPRRVTARDLERPIRREAMPRPGGRA